MIHREQYTKNGVTLYRTFSDTDRMIRNKATQEIFSQAVDTHDDNEYEELDEYIELDGASNISEIQDLQEQISKATRKINRIGLTNKEALSVKEFYPRWQELIGRTLEQGFVVLSDDKLWRVRQTHTAQADWKPSLNTASLWEVIDVEHSGTLDDPIPYSVPMEIFNGKYYTEDGITYLCTRDSGIALSHPLSALVGVYVKLG